MIRMIQRKLIIPRGDTGSFSIPALTTVENGDVAVFSIIDALTHTIIGARKLVSVTGDTLTVEFTHNDTVNLPVGKYFWDIKYYRNPVFADGELVNGEEVNSYYAAYSLPQCEIRETADNLLVSDNSPTATLTAEQLDIISAALAALSQAVIDTQTNVTHYPIIQNDTWYVWDVTTNDYVSTDVSANGIVGPAGNGISSIVKSGTAGLIDTYTINFTDGTSTTFTVKNGAVPDLTIGTVTEGATAAATITGTADAPVLNLVLPNANVPTRVSELENDSHYAVDANYVHTDNNYTNDEKIKLNGIAAGAEVNVNADWNAISGDAQILNKPTNVSDFTNDAGYLTEHQNISGKVDKITGKGLSTNDFTDAYKTKLDNALTSFTETDPTVPAWAKAAQKPTYTAAEVGAPTVAEMNQAIANVNTMKIHICAHGEYDSETGVPTIQNPDTQTFYLVPGGEGSNLFIEWAYVNSAWERFGSADVEIPVTDVQVNGTSIVDNEGVANVPLASANTFGAVKLGDTLSINAVNKINTKSASSSVIKLGAASGSFITPEHQHEAAFFGIAKAAGDSTQSQSNNAVGTYTAEAKTAIQTMLDVPAKSDIPDIQINGTSIVNNAVANIPVASSSVPGVVRIGLGSTGITIDDTNTLKLFSASDSYIKMGTHESVAVPLARQHTAVFYGLAKAAGVDMASSSNAVGTYTAAAQTAINTMIGSVSKYNLDNAGITAKTYDIKFGGEFNVTTATNAYDISPYARASVTGRISKHHMHKVTVNGTEYILPTRLWYESSAGTLSYKVYEYLGNLSLYKADVSGVPGGTDNVPFIIISDLNDNSSIDVFTQTAGTYTIKVEQINNTQTKLPNSLIWADNYVPIEKKNNNGTYNGFSIGVNELRNTRATFAIGYANSIQNEFSIAIGQRNIVTGSNSIAIGYTCNVSGSFSTAFGVNTRTNTGSMFVLGRANRNANTTIETWAANTYYEAGTMVRATFGGAASLNYICKISHTSSTSFDNDILNWVTLPSNGDTAFAIGNGVINSSSGSNAVKINWAGGAFFGSDVYVNCDKTSANGKKVATVDQIPAVPVQDVQVNGTSVISNGVANVPVGGVNTFGVYKVGQDSDYTGIQLDANGYLKLAYANSARVKDGTNFYKPIVPLTQHESTFYGLAKAAGDTTQALSDNAVGTYTDNAKSAIRTMLDAASPDLVDIQTTQPTATDNKLWIDTDAATGIQVPTVSEMNTALSGKVSDVQVNGTSIVANGVANVPMASTSSLGVSGVMDSFGILVNNNGKLYINTANLNEIKAGSQGYKPIVSANAYTAVFYGLAKASGDTTQSASSNTVGTYTDSAKASIKQMLGIVDGSTGTVDISGSTPTITALENTRYVCGEVSTLSFTPAASGICIVRFTSGSTATVLTVPNTVKFPEWFDSTELETNTIYEICVTDGVYGAVMLWAQ